MDKLMLELLSFHVFCLQERFLNIDVMLVSVKMLFLQVKCSLLLKNLLSFNLKSHTGLLDLLLDLFKLNLLLLESNLLLLQLLCISLNQLLLLVKHPLVLPHLVFLISQLLLSLFNLNLSRLDLPDVVLSLLLL